MPQIFPIPGSTSVERIKENASAVHVQLTETEMEKIDQLVKRCDVAGDRYHAGGMQTLDV